MSPGSRGRRRLGLAAIAVAALATAATSQAPPTPDVSSDEVVRMQLTADEPVAWLTAEARPNAALADSDSHTTMTVSGRASDTGVLFMTGDADGAQQPPRIGSGYEVAYCQPECTPLRMMAMLVDPVESATVDVDWTITAAAQFPEAGPVPDAGIDVETSPLQTGAAADLGLGFTDRERIELSADVPRVTRSVLLTLPDGPAVDPILAPDAFIRLGDLRDGELRGDPAALRIALDGNLVVEGWQSTTVAPFAACLPGAACEVELTLEFDWNGGGSEVVPIEWSIAAWPGISGDADAGARGAAEIAVASDEIEWDDPLLAATTSGQSRVGTDGGTSVPLTATLDLRDTPQGNGPIDGLVRLTFEATLPPDSPADAAVSMVLQPESTIVTARPREPGVSYSRVEPVQCTARTTCPIEFPVSLYVPGDDLPEALVDWTARVEFLELGGEGRADAGRMTLEQSAAPSP